MLNESNKRDVATSTACNIKKNSLTFKDWKLLKDNQSKPNEKYKNINDAKLRAESAASNTPVFHASSDIRSRLNYNKCFSGSSFPWKNDLADILPADNYDGTNFNNCKMPGNIYDLTNDCFNRFRISNNFNRGIDAGWNMCTNLKNSKVPNNLATLIELQKCYRKNHYGYNNYNKDCNNLDELQNFFTSDCVYAQRDVMQKPLSNPFRCAQNDDPLYQQLSKPRRNKNHKRINNKRNKETGNPTNNSHQTASDDIKTKSIEPEVYIPNPKAILGGKPYIPKPKCPLQNSELSSEDKKQQWKEYRQAMKPFKNRDFYNAKRVVQRLGKKPSSELNEKEVIRLANAQEYMATHKARLNAKYPNYIKVDDNCNNLGELYILKTVPINQPNTSTNCNNFKSSRPDVAATNAFVSRGSLETTAQTFQSP